MLDAIKKLFSKTPQEGRVRSTANSILENATAVEKAYKRKEITKSAYEASMKSSQSKMRSLNSSPDNYDTMSDKERKKMGMTSRPRGR